MQSLDPSFETTNYFYRKQYQVARPNTQSEVGWN